MGHYFFYKITTQQRSGQTKSTNGWIKALCFYDAYKKIHDDNKTHSGFVMDFIIPIEKKDFYSLSNEYSPGWNDDI